MDTLSYKTVSVNKATANKGWVVIDANDEVLGRLASRVALILRGKNKPSFTPHADCGDNVIIINADKVRFNLELMSYIYPKRKSIEVKDDTGKEEKFSFKLAYTTGEK